MENNNKNEQVISDQMDIMAEKAFETYAYNFWAGLKSLKTLLRNEALSQNAFTRSILAGFESGVAPADYKPNLQSEDEEKVANLISQLIDLKLTIKMYQMKQQTSQNETQTNNIQGDDKNGKMD